MVTGMTGFIESAWVKYAPSFDDLIEAWREAGEYRKTCPEKIFIVHNLYEETASGHN
jgi:hypothetical protein